MAAEKPTRLQVKHAIGDLDDRIKDLEGSLVIAKDTRRKLRAALGEMPKGKTGEVKEGKVKKGGVNRRPTGPPPPPPKGQGGSH